MTRDATTSRIRTTWCGSAVPARDATREPLVLVTGQDRRVGRPGRRNGHAAPRRRADVMRSGHATRTR